LNSKPIPFFRPEIGSDEINEVVAALRSGWLTTGPKTKQFENDSAAYAGMKHAVALNSATAALHLALEAIGLSRALVAEHFPAMVSRISGIGLNGIQKKVLEQHATAYNEEVVALPVGGFYRFRKSGDRHGWEGGVIHTLQQAVTNDSYTTFKKYSEQVNKRPPMQLRDLLELRSTKAPVPVDEVESITAIRKRFITPGMSMGALSPEAHGTLNVAMNRIGAKSDSGEGGEDPARFRPDKNGDNWNSAIKQVASGRFGVTPSI